MELSVISEVYITIMRCLMEGQCSPGLFLLRKFPTTLEFNEHYRKKLLATVDIIQKYIFTTSTFQHS